MGEILSAIRLKDKVTIVILMSILALLLTGSVGVVSYATRHQHNYEYHLEKGADGEFDFVGLCDSDDCDTPVYVRDIAPGEVQGTVTKSATCCELGKKTYSFTLGGIEYVLEEDIPVLDHRYDLDGGINGETISGSCTNEGCTSPDLEINKSEISGLTLVEKIDATCNSPRVEKYTYFVGEEQKTLVAIEYENIAHTVGGVPVTDHLLYKTLNGIEVYKYGADGLYAVPISGTPICENEVNAYYICEKCSTTMHVFVYKDDHTYALSTKEGEEIVNPDFDNEGTAYLRCVEKDCDGHKEIKLPAVVIGDNAEVVEQFKDTESQLVKYTYLVEDYNITVEMEIILPWISHDFDVVLDNIVYPTFESDGSVTLKCKNSVCSEERVVVLPRLEVGVNTTITRDHILETETVSYTYLIEEYDITITNEYKNEWIDHTYVYAEGDTILPTLDSDGKAYVRCSYEGCEKYHEIVIPKIEIGKNTTLVSSATEQAVRVDNYTYVNEEYGFTVTFNIDVGERLTHNYKYHIDIVGFNKVIFVGNCSQPGCQQPETREEVDAITEEIAPDCVTEGLLIFRYERDGIVYEETMPFFPLGHDYEVVSVVNPTEQAAGSAVIKCSRDGCNDTHEINLPEIVIGADGNSVETEFIQDQEIKKVEYNHTDRKYKVDVKLELVIPWPEHSFAVDESETILPTLDSEGRVTLYCQNSVCSESHEIILPKLVIGEGGNGEEIAFNQDKESKTVRYTHLIEEYGVTVTLDLTLPWPEHRFEIKTTETEYPTFDTEGKAVLYCQNSVCSERIEVALPRLEVGKNTTILHDHILETETVIYVYENTEYGFIVTFSYDNVWIDHTYEYKADETVMPTVDSDGVAYVRCTFEGCDKHYEVVIPKIEVGVNTVTVSDATEQHSRIERYTFECNTEDYSFKIEFDHYVGSPLKHEYTYDLVYNESTGKFDLVGVCGQLGCQEPEVTDSGVEAIIFEVPATCTTPKKVVASYEKNGETYVKETEVGSSLGHDYLIIESADPTYEMEGFANVYCNRDDCVHSTLVVLPKIEMGVTAFEAVEGDGLYYMYYDEESGYEHFFIIY